LLLASRHDRGRSTISRLRSCSDTKF
jgi:hypothetical protein